MEDTSNSSLKRVRQEEQENEEIIKRQKSYKDIITLLEEEEDDPNEDISSLISTLQEEIISSTGSNPVLSGPTELDPVYSGSGESGSGGEEEEVEKVMKHLLEASDDELGIPNLSGEMNGYDVVEEGHVDGLDLFLPVGEGLWEFEDHEANNYYEYSSLLQSEIFISTNSHRRRSLSVINWRRIVFFSQYTSDTIHEDAPFLPHLPSHLTYCERDPIRLQLVTNKTL